MIDKGIYKEPTSFKISEVEPYCTPQEIKKIKDQDKAVVDLTKKLVFNSFEALANYITK